MSGICSSRLSSLLNTPLTRVPSATMQAPVSVATSTIRSGLPALAVVMPSARTNRPSASVLRTSTVLPPYIVRTSPGRVACPDGMFSARQAYVVTRTGIARAAMANVADATAAAPDMSHFIVCMDDAGLIDRPPESKVMPLPTNAMWARALGGLYVSRTSRGGRAEPMPTPMMPP